MLDKDRIEDLMPHDELLSKLSVWSKPNTMEWINLILDKDRNVDLMPCDELPIDLSMKSKSSTL